MVAISFRSQYTEFVCRGDTEVEERTADLRVKNDGTVFWISHRSYASACLVDLTYYPFDTQHCELWFQSLAYTSSQLTLKVYLPGFDLETQLSGFRESDEWEVLSNKSEVIRYPSDEGETLVFSNKISLRLSLSLKRRAGFIAYLLTVPCVVLSGMTLMVFVLPQERPDRHVIGMCVLPSEIMMSSSASNILLLWDLF